MANKWLIYAATYATYSLVHSIRTCWASLKTVFTDSPFQFSQKYLGTLDTVVLFAVAILLNVFGGQVEKYPRRKLLFPMLGGLTLNLLLLFIFVFKEITSQVLYFFFYTTIGILSCLAWPICLYTLSQYFTSHNAIALSMWSSVAQCGDFVAFLITLIIVWNSNVSPAYSLLVLMVLMIMLIIFDYFFFRDKGNQQEQPSAINQVQTPQNQINMELEDNPHKKGSDAELKQSSLDSKKNEKRRRSRKTDNRIKQSEDKSNNNQNKYKKNQRNLQNISAPIPRYMDDNQIESKPKSQPQPQQIKSEHEKEREQQNQSKNQNTSQIKQSKAGSKLIINQHTTSSNFPSPQTPVNFLTVWLLPGVALPVLAFSTTKSINAIIVSWLVLYFTKIEMITQSRIIAIVWTFSIVLGGFIGAKINSQLSYKIFIACMFVAGFVFYMLEGLHMHSNQFTIILLMAICGILVGVPYNQLGTSVPFKLAQNPQICNRPKAKSAIISLMESFAQIICGICILIVPGIGVMRLHYMAGALCFASVLLLAGEQLRLYVNLKDDLEHTVIRNAAPPISIKQEI